MKKILAVFLISSSIALGMIAFGVVNRSATTGPNPNADSFSQGPAVDTSSVIVQLKGDPLSTIPLRSRYTAEKLISKAAP